jgi:hypothetical protein
MTKEEAWRHWWYEKHGKHIPAGGYHRMEGAIYDAWVTGWDAAESQCKLEIMHLKAQLLRVGTNEGAYKAAYLAGQMSMKEKK